MPCYSFSQIKTYINCPLQYKFKYVDNIRPEFEQNLHLILGTSVHSSLEFLYEKINVFGIIKLEELLEYFENIFNKSIKEIDADIVEIEEFKTRGLVYLESFYKKNHPFEGFKVVGTELRIYIDLGDGIKFQGSIDRLDKKDDIFIITDYKTNKNLLSSDEILHQEQLTLYALGVSQKYGKYLNSLFGNLEYLHFETVDNWKIDEKQINDVSKKYKNLAIEIEKNKEKYISGDENAFPTNESNLCKFCDYKELCPLFSQLYVEIKDSEISDQTVKNLTDEYIKLYTRRSEINFDLEKIQEILKPYTKRNKLKRLYSDLGSISVSNNINYSTLDNEKLLEYLENEKKLQDFLSIDRFKLARSIKNSEINFDEVHDFVQKKESVTFRVSKNKKG